MNHIQFFSIKHDAVKKKNAGFEQMHTLLVPQSLNEGFSDRDYFLTLITDYPVQYRFDPRG